MRNEKIKFIWKSSLFLLLLGLVLFIFNFFYVYAMKKNRPIYLAESNFQKYIKTLDKKQIKYAFFGDSHTQYSIKPDLINNSYNFGYKNELYSETYLKLKKIIQKDKVKIENLMLQIDLHSMYNNKKALNDIHYYSQFNSTKDLNKVINGNLIVTWLNINFPFIQKGMLMINFLTNFTERSNKSNLTLMGWTANKNNNDSTFNQKAAYERAKKHFSNKKQEDQMLYLLRIIDLAKNENINIYFINFPISKKYFISSIKLNIAKKEYYDQIFKKIDYTYPNIKYKTLNYQNIFFNNQEYFEDPDHLNIIGADILSKQINQDLQK